MIKKDTIDKIFEVSRVEEVIGEFVSLKKSGSNFKGLSPFTNEKTPSFMVSPVKQIWKDFSSGKGGNVVAFLMEHEHFSYPDALRFLAKKYNILIEETQETEAEKQKTSEKESLFLINQFASKFFIENLFKKDEGLSIGLSYLKERGFSNEIIEKFVVGYSLDLKNDFFNSAIEFGYLKENIEKSGLIINNSKGIVDRFRARVIFPIRSIAGRIQGFGGRILSNKLNVAKYINSPESIVYIKSKVLYGIFESKKAIANKDLCYLVEGYTDVIQMHESGIENVVSSSGTALSIDQIQIIKRLTKNVTLLFDSDEAGLRASLRGIDLFLDQGINVKILVFPKGMDPDSFVRGRQKQDILKYFNKNSKDFIQFKANLLLKDSLDDPIRKSSAIKDIIISISKIPDLIQQEIFVKKCSELMDISEKVLFNVLEQEKNKIRFKNKRNNISKNSLEVVENISNEKKIDLEIVSLEKQIVHILLHYGKEEAFFDEIFLLHGENGQIIEESKIVKSKVYEKIFLDLQQDEVELINPLYQELYIKLIELYQTEGKVTIDKLIRNLKPDLSQIVSDLLLSDEIYELHNWDKRNVFVKEKKSLVGQLVSETILSLRKNLIDQKIKTLVKNSKEKKGLSNNPDFLSEVINYQNLKKLLSKKLNRVI
ncbi:MAG: DNA primase [Flavobacteriaceae bacterium]|nr:DNA primase [Flavobacteriaceae bacterium]